jgi:hypothetical protein
MNQVAKQEVIDPETGDLEIIEQSGPLTTIAAEVNAQVATARQYPRRRAVDIARSIEGLACLDVPTSESCMYSLPRGGKTIEGPSIRFAEICQQVWGNNRVSGKVEGIDRVNMRVFAEGIYFDCETNSATRIVISRRIASTDKKTGQSRIFNDDMIQVAGSAAVSIARRNAILAGIPRAVWHGAYESVRLVVMGDIKTLANRRAAALTEFQRFGLTAAQVFAVLGVKDENDITLEHLVTLRGTLTGLRSGEVTVEDLFRQPQPHPPTTPNEQPKPATVAAALDKFGEQPGQETEAKPEAVAANLTTAAREDIAQRVADKLTEGSDQPGAIQETAAAARKAQLDAAVEKGKEAKGRGTRRSAVPGEYRADKELSDAWCRGWDGLV